MYNSRKLRTPTEESKQKKFHSENMSYLLLLLSLCGDTHSERERYREKEKERAVQRESIKTLTKRKMKGAKER